MFNLEYLAEMADPLEVAEAIGLETRRKGNRIYCECPSHRKVLGKADNNVGNCILTQRGYHCFACNTSGSVFDMVMDYCGLSFGQAVKKIALLTGGDCEIDECSAKKEQMKQPFKSEDLEMIGLSSLANPKGDAGREIIGVSRFRPTSGAFFRRGDEYVTYSSVKRITLNTLFQEDPAVYYQLIADNAEIALRKHRELLACFDDRGSEMFEKVFNVISVDGAVDARLVSEIKNILSLRIKKIERMLKGARAAL